jgi:hypothetical protein
MNQYLGIIQKKQQEYDHHPAFDQTFSIGLITFEIG